MRPVVRGSWHMARIVSACTLVIGGCASLESTTTTLVTPVKYAWVGADRGLRTHLQRGLTQLASADSQGAVRSLNRAIWDLQRIEDRGLRMEELARAHRAIGDAYRSGQKPDWAQDEWKLAAAFDARSVQAVVPGDRPSPLDRGKAAYVSAHFPDSVFWLRRALVDVEEAEEFFARLKQLEEAHCYLGFAYVALGQEDRAREEFHRLAALDASVTFCSCAAAPKARRLISDVQRSTPR